MQKKTKNVATASALAGFDWASLRSGLLGSIAQASLADYSGMWSHGVAEEAFMGCFTRLAAACFEDASLAKDKQLRGTAALLLVAAAGRCPAIGSSAAVAAMTRVQRLDHAAVALVAGLGAVSADPGSCLPGGQADAGALRSARDSVTSLVRELLVEVGRLAAGSSRDTAGSRHLASFLSELSDTLPLAVLQNLSALHRHLDGDAYALRSAVVSALASLLGRLFTPAAMQEAEAAAAGALGAPDGEEGGGTKNLQTARARDTLLDILVTRVMDKHALARAACLRSWGTVVASGSLPMARWGQVTALAADRLQDTSSLARRAALQLLGLCLEHNPFAGTLRAGTFEAFARAEGAWLAEHTGGDTRLKVHKLIGSVMGGDTANQVCPPPKEGDAQAQAEADAAAAAASGGGGGDAQEGGSDAISAEAAQHLKQLQFAAWALRCVQALELALPRVTALLRSRTTSDVTEGMKLLVKARAFGLAGSHTALQALLTLVWSDERAISDTVITSFVHLYLSVDAAAAADAGKAAAATAEEHDDSDEEESGSAGLGRQGKITGLDGGKRVPAAPAVAARNLVALAQGASAGVAASLEAILSTLAKQGDISAVLCDALWDIVGRGAMALSAGEAPSSPAAAAGRTAMALLQMMVHALPDIVNTETGITRLRFVLKRPREAARFDYHMARAACMAATGGCTVLSGTPGTPAAIAAAEDLNVGITRSGGARGVAAEQVARSGGVQGLLQSIIGLLTGQWDGGAVEDAAWYGAAEAGIAALFVLSPRPEQVVAGVLHTMLLTAFPGGEEGEAPAEALAGTNVGAWSGEALAAAAAQGLVPAAVLSRLFFVAGQAALKLLVYSEAMAKAVKRIRGGVSDKLVRAAVAAKANKRKKRLSRRLSRGSVGSAGAAEEEHKGGQGGSQEASGGGAARDGIEEQLGGGGVTADAEEEAVAALADVGIVQDGLLALVGPLLERVIGNAGGCFGNTATGGGEDGAGPTEASNPPTAPLARASVLSLCKFMAVSRSYCEAQLPLLFTVLERSGDAAIKCSVVVALGDLTVRFPNLLEPWNDRLYLRLRDSDVRVRRNALSVLSHLILNDMIKVRGTMAEIAALLQDKERTISSSARVFFLELSKRTNNPVYNLLPDTLSGLWVHPAVSPAAFRDIMRFLLSCVTKDKHIEGLLDKLAHRFEIGDDEQVWRATSYCLGQLAPQLTEKGIRKLIESFRCYKRCLCDAPVAEHFGTLVAAAGKLAEKKGGEMSAVVEEWRAAVAGAAAGASEDGDVAKRAAAAKGTKAARDAAAEAAAAAEASVIASIAQRKEAAEGAATEKAAAAKAARSAAAAKRRAAAAAKKQQAAKAAGGSDSDSDSDISEY